jgi:predicted metal-dependent HD superfamily phosphohydrolase
MSNLDELHQKWQKCWVDPVGKIRFEQQKIDRIFQMLIAAYTEPDRHYHNLQHIHHVLTIIERFTLRLQDPIAVYLAVWFHDFVYDSQSADNEFQSAQAAKELLTDLGESMVLIDRVQQLILATHGHQVDLNDSDRCIFLDADLAILGVDSARYQIYQQSIRNEYSWVSDAAYKIGRVRVLEGFLQRDRLYYTDTLFDQLESRSRLNMAREIAELVSSSCQIRQLGELVDSG